VCPHCRRGSKPRRSYLPRRRNADGFHFAAKRCSLRLRRQAQEGRLGRANGSDCDLSKDRCMLVRRARGDSFRAAAAGARLHLPRLPAADGQRVFLHRVLCGNCCSDRRRSAKFSTHCRCRPVARVELLPIMRLHGVRPHGGDAGCHCNPGWMFRGAGLRRARPPVLDRSPPSLARHAARRGNGGEAVARSAVIPGRRASAGPESRCLLGVCLWIPGLQASLAPQNDPGG